MFNKRSGERVTNEINGYCNFERFADESISTVIDSLTQEVTDSIPESENSENSENLKTIDQINFESNYDIVDVSENSENTD